MASSNRNQHLFSVKSQYMVRDNSDKFTSSSPRPEADGGEMLDRGGETSENVQQRFRKPNTKPAFLDSKNRNSTDLAFRQRQSQKDVHFMGSPRHEHENKVAGKKSGRQS